MPTLTLGFKWSQDPGNGSPVIPNARRGCPPKMGSCFPKKGNLTAQTNTLGPP